MKKIGLIISFIVIGFVLIGCTTKGVLPTITVEENNVEINLDDFKKIEPILNGDFGLVFESLDESVFTVDSSGLVTPIAIGSGILKISLVGYDAFVVVNITVTLPDEENEEIVKELIGIDIICNSSVLKAGETVQLSVLGSYEYQENGVLKTQSNIVEEDVVWMSSNPSVVGVSETGEIMAVEAGSATVSVVINNRFSSISITVIKNNDVVIPSITIDAPSFIKVGDDASIDITSSNNVAVENLIFSSSDIEILSISSLGIISGLKSGSVMVTILLEGSDEVLATHTIVVLEAVNSGSEIELDSISITGSKEVLAGSKILLNISYLPNTVSATFSYSSSDETVATVSSTGWVTGVTGGAVQITVTCVENNVYKAVYNVSVIPLVSAITITGADSVSYSNNILLSVTAEPSGASSAVVWESSDTSIASVDINGRVTGLKAGSVVITATSVTNSLVSATKTITVTDEMSIILNPQTASITVGSNVIINAFVVAASLSDKTVNWTSSNNTVATVDQTGKVTGVAAGSATVVAKLNADSSIQAQISITVTATLKPTITLSATSASLVAGTTKALTATVKNTANTAVTWSSSNTSIATVNSTGVVTAASAGTATITATCQADKTVKATCSITVTAAPSKVLTITADPSASIKVGATGYQVYVRDEAGVAISRTECTFTSSASTVATVSTYGTIAALKAGTTKITVTHPTKGTGTITLTVIAYTQITTTAPRYYPTEANFKASPAYKKYTSYASKVVYDYSFAIPGMAKTNHAGKTVTTLVPQGLTAAGDYFLVSAYDSTGAVNSVIYVISSSGSFITTIILPSKAHIGGLAYDGRNVWVTGSGTTIYCFKYSVLTTADNSGKEYYTLSSYLKSYTVKCTPSFLSYYNGRVWVGKFNETSNDYMYSYKVGNVTGTPTLTRENHMEVPNRTQGAAFTSSGYLVLSRSYARNPSSSVYISELRCYKPSWSSPRSDGLIYKNNAVSTLTLPPMAEGAVVKGSYLYLAFESCATTYNNCPYITDRVIAFKTSSFF
ncbi:MAG: Ig-like domain-containing protein [Bacilli bacterium]|nr:Ig-like domain-containing protein [Bacilli bacterium]